MDQRLSIIFGNQGIWFLIDIDQPENQSSKSCFFWDSFPSWAGWLPHLVFHCFRFPKCKASPWFCSDLHAICLGNSSKIIDYPDGCILWIEDFSEWPSKHLKVPETFDLYCRNFLQVPHKRKLNNLRFRAHCSHWDLWGANFWGNIWKLALVWEHIGELSSYSMYFPNFQGLTFPGVSRNRELGMPF